MEDGYSLQVLRLDIPVFKDEILKEQFDDIALIS